MQEEKYEKGTFKDKECLKSSYMEIRATEMIGGLEHLPYGDLSPVRELGLFSL